MKIALDARWIFEHLSGIGIYTRALIEELAALDRENEYLLLFDRESLRDRTRRDTGFDRAENFRAEERPSLSKSLRSAIA